MIVNKCFECGESLSLNTRQIGIEICGQVQSLHVHCSDILADKEIEVWKVTANQSSFVEDKFEHIEDMLRDMDIHSEYIISKIKMKKIKYLTLTEFKGF